MKKPSKLEEQAYPPGHVLSILHTQFGVDLVRGCFHVMLLGPECAAAINGQTALDFPRGTVQAAHHLVGIPRPQAAALEFIWILQELPVTSSISTTVICFLS